MLGVSFIVKGLNTVIFLSQLIMDKNIFSLFFFYIYSNCLGLGSVHSLKKGSNFFNVTGWSGDGFRAKRVRKHGEPAKESGITSQLILFLNM